MSRLVLPKFKLHQGSARDLVPQSVLDRWNASLAAKDDEEDKKEVVTIDIYDFIGGDGNGGGWTDGRVSGILRRNRGKNITVNLNSPGGDLFQGVAIYNLLKDHDGEITTRVIGLAASAASVIAMAGKRRLVARASATMIHNVWVLSIGNRNDLREVADQLDIFDDMLAGAYAEATGNDKKAIAKMMDKETYFSGEQAIENGFADAFLPADVVEEKETEAEDPAAQAVRAMESDLMKAGLSRSQARARINALKKTLGTPDAAEPKDRSTPDAAPKATPDAGSDVKSMVDSFLESIHT